MSAGYSTWADVKAKAAALDPRSEAERAAGEAAARERREAYVRGYQLADALGVSQARISKIEHGEVSGIDVVRAYVAALGGHLDLVATLGDRTWKVA
jgi:hypothetical protein